MNVYQEGEEGEEPVQVTQPNDADNIRILERQQQLSRKRFHDHFIPLCVLLFVLAIVTSFCLPFFVIPTRDKVNHQEKGICTITDNHQTQHTICESGKVCNTYQYHISTPCSKNASTTAIAYCKNDLNCDAIWSDHSNFSVPCYYDNRCHNVFSYSFEKFEDMSALYAIFIGAPLFAVGFGISIAKHSLNSILNKYQKACFFILSLLYFGLFAINIAFSF